MTSEYNCPICDWEPPEFDGTFYKIVDGKVKKDLSDWDLEETKLPLPDNYYPKFGPRHIEQGEYFGYNWEETYLCPHCNKEFSFINSSI